MKQFQKLKIGDNLFEIKNNEVLTLKIKSIYLLPSLLMKIGFEDNDDLIVAIEWTSHKQYHAGIESVKAHIDHLMGSLYNLKHYNEVKHLFIEEGVL